MKKWDVGGCYYDGNTLEEAKNNLKKLVELRKNKCREIKFDTCICGTKDLEIVLRALDELLRKEQSRIIGNIHEIKIEDLEPILKPYYISKKKIEDKIKEVDNKFAERTYYNGWGIIKDFKELLDE